MSNLNICKINQRQNPYESRGKRLKFLREEINEI